MPLAIPICFLMAKKRQEDPFRAYLRDIGAKIRTLRDDQGLTTEQAAERAGMSPGFWGLVERAIKQPSLSSVFRFAEALDVEVVDLVAVGRASPRMLAKSRRGQLDKILDEATPGQVQAIVTCAKAILRLGEDPRLVPTSSR